ncbi:MAG: hypothetical protein UZ18_ATM001000105 [Armatimonadetes bacterium OLB18]|nr:MAG: hypothetical protein UZ18_ATM001000105 [Armatimonadetes bacterium OLB18]
MARIKRDGPGLRAIVQLAIAGITDPLLAAR